MQIIDLYIRGGDKFTSTGSFPTSTRLVDTSTTFTVGDFKVGQIIKNLNSGVEGEITAIAPSGNFNTLDISGGVFSGNNQAYQIYDQFTKLELFKDESVSITDTIQNVKDPAKIFAPFSQQFSVPASKNNNRFFKHYYDSEIQNSYDARFQGDALIQLNGSNYKIGKLKLTSVELKNNVAYSYKLVFTGETVEFKELLSGNELSSLIYPESLDFVYNNDFVKSKFIGSAEGDDLIFPLITHSKNMRYNNGQYKDYITGDWINFADLKPALKTKVIIDAIETTYPQIKFSQQFLNSSNFRKLYMWLHREEGFLSNATEGGGVQTISNWFALPENTANNYEYSSGTELRPAQPEFLEGFLSPTIVYEFYLTVSTLDPNQSYDVQILKGSDSSTLLDENGTGLQTFRYDFTPEAYGEQDILVKININAENTVGISQSLVVKKVRRISTITQLLATGNYFKDAPVSENTITISRQMPKMKIFDFLKNLFLMYNLTAYKEDGIINILPLDDYYNAGKVYDITEYVDTSKSTISKLLQFRNMIFNFKSKKSFLVQYAEEFQGNIFAQESYNSESQFDGGEYKIELDFEKMMYERLSDETTGTLTTIGQGAMLDKKFEPTIGKPLLFYAASTSTSTTNLNWDNLNNTLTGISSYLRPSNSISNTTTGFLTETLNFGVEIDEFTLGSGTEAQINSPNDLYSKYYRNYVSNLFAKNSRKTNVSAYLPLNIILKYNLNDIFIIGTTEYRINSVKTNLLTNKSDLELYNLQVNTSQSLNGQRQDLQRIQNLETTIKTSSTINFSWDKISDSNFVKYEIYLDGEFKDFNLPNDVSYGFSSLDSNTTYKISLRPIYDIDGIEFAAFDTDLFETTL